MIDFENKEERDKLIDDYFNKDIEVNKKDVYWVIVNTIADLEYENEELKKQLNNIKKES